MENVRGERRGRDGGYQSETEHLTNIRDEGPETGTNRAAETVRSGGG